MLGKVGGWVVIEDLTHTELWVEYNLPYFNFVVRKFLFHNTTSNCLLTSHKLYQ